MSFLTGRTFGRVPTSLPLLRRQQPTARTAIASTRRLQAACAVSSFHTSSARAAMSESDHDHPDRETHIETHKQDALEKQKDGKGHWKRELSSNSEAAIKADRGEVDASEETIKELQKETEKLAEEAKKE